MIGSGLARYAVRRVTEAGMPKTKRADLAFVGGKIATADGGKKGQLHPDGWDAATVQLDAQYLID
jgi:hypothetical protein